MIAWRAQIVACALLFAGCDVGEPEPERRSPKKGTALRALQAIGYADWDPDTDGSLAGVVVHDRERTQPGYVLHADERSRVLLLDRDGRLAHDWTIPARDQVEHASVLPDGRCLAVSVDQGLTMVDRDGRELWRRDGNAHHEVAALADGTFVTLEWTEREYRGRRVRFDELVFVDAGGTALRTWSTWEHRDELGALHEPLPLDVTAPGSGSDETVYDYYHLNAVFEDVRAGELVVSARNASLVFALTRASLELTWSIGPSELDFPHTPSITPAGTALVFDNGWHRGWSRLVELDVPGGEVRWSYMADPRESFFTQRRGSCQRLANGNTLVCESERGHAFELAPDGDVVWEYWNPETVDGRRKRIYRVTHVASGDVPFLEEPR